MTKDPPKTLLHYTCSKSVVKP